MDHAGSCGFRDPETLGDLNRIVAKQEQCIGRWLAPWPLIVAGKLDERFSHSTLRFIRASLQRAQRAEVNGTLQCSGSRQSGLELVADTGEEVGAGRSAAWEEEGCGLEWAPEAVGRLWTASGSAVRDADGE